MIILSFFVLLDSYDYFTQGILFYLSCSVLLDTRSTMIILSFLFSFIRQEEYYDYFIFLVQFY